MFDISGFLDLGSSVSSFSLTVLVRISALLVMQTDYLNFACWPGGGSAPGNYILPNVRWTMEL